MNTEALLKLLIGVAGGVASLLATLVVFVWRASHAWTNAGAQAGELVRQVRELVARVDLMNGQLDSLRIWRASHQATSDAQIERLDQIEKEISR